jgi:hypothetical protein
MDKVFGEHNKEPMYHFVTGQNVKYLLSGQNKSEDISTFTKINKDTFIDFLTYGVSDDLKEIENGGMLAELNGNTNARFGFDVYSFADNQNRRWAPLHRVVSAAVFNKLSKERGLYWELFTKKTWKNLNKFGVDKDELFAHYKTAGISSLKKSKPWFSDRHDYNSCAQLIKMGPKTPEFKNFLNYTVETYIEWLVDKFLPKHAAQLERYFFHSKKVKYYDELVASQYTVTQFHLVFIQRYSWMVDTVKTAADIHALTETKEKVSKNEMQYFKNFSEGLKTIENSGISYKLDIDVFRKNNAVMALWKLLKAKLS